MFFKHKKLPQPDELDIIRQKVNNQHFEIEELARSFRILEQKVSIIDIDMRYLQSKFKDKIFKRNNEIQEREENESFKFINPFK